MGIASDIAADWDAALAALDWQLDCGVDEVLGDAPVNRYDAAPPPPLPERATTSAVAARRPVAAEPAPVVERVNPVAVAQTAADGAATLQDLRAAVEGFDLCEIKKGARNTVFSDGNPKARVLILGEAPGRDEDLAGRPFVGRAGQLLDRMFAAIGLTRQSPEPEAALYITNVMFWRPPGNRDPDPEEIAMMKPFIARHIALADPEVVVTMGNTPLFAMTGARGIMKARGIWTEALGKPMLPMAHPAYLLRNPLAKREAWADLLMLKARLMGQAR